MVLWSKWSRLVIGGGDRPCPTSNMSRAQGWHLGTVVRHFEAHWLEHPRWKSVSSRSSDRWSSQTWREDGKPPTAHFLVSLFGSVPYENKKWSPKYWPVAWPQDAAIQCASSWSLENSLLFPACVQIPRGRKWAWSLCFCLILYGLHRKK